MSKELSKSILRDKTMMTGYYSPLSIWEPAWIFKDIAFWNFWRTLWWFRAPYSLPLWQLAKIIHNFFFWLIHMNC